MKNILILWLLLGVSLSAFAQTITIKDQETQEPVEWVSLRSESPEASAITNGKGQADITAFYPFPFTEANLNNGALTGSIGGVYRPSDSWVISANFATAFRSPNVDDMGKVFDSEPGSVVVPNPDLEAEYAYNVDLGMAKVFGEIVRIDLAGYYTSLQNAMVRRDFTLDGQEYIVYDGVSSQVQAIQNAAVANVYGIQAGIEVKLPRGFGFSSDFNYQEGEEELDDGTTSPSRHAAPWFGVSRLTYTVDKLSIQIYAEYQGERKLQRLSNPCYNFAVLTMWRCGPIFCSHLWLWRCRLSA